MFFVHFAQNDNLFCLVLLIYIRNTIGIGMNAFGRYTYDIFKIFDYDFVVCSHCGSQIGMIPVDFDKYLEHL